MCTVTIVPRGCGFRLVCNRDERRDRPAATPPAVHHLQHGAAIYPVDPAGKGTWVGVNDTGLAAALLNRTADGASTSAHAPLRSRGVIIPHLLGCRSLTDALGVAAALDPTQFDLFRLILVQPLAAVVLTSDGLALSMATMGVSRPLMLTSSSLGDAVVEPPRRRLFEQLISNSEGAWLAAQARFHAHRWRSRPDISVTMARSDARTVSRTLIDVTPNMIELRYWPVSPATSWAGRAA